MVLKMKEWMFECTGEWNVFLFSDEQTIEAYKVTLKAYENSFSKSRVNSPPFTLEEIPNQNEVPKCVM